MKFLLLYNSSFVIGFDTISLYSILDKDLLVILRGFFSNTLFLILNAISISLDSTNLLSFNFIDLVIFSLLFISKYILL